MTTKYFENACHKTIIGFENYEIFNNGMVWSRLKNKFLSPWKDKKGYRIITLHNSSGSKNFRLHRLVAFYFVPNPENKPDVNHKDENKDNNCFDNLEWVTKDENNKYGTRSMRSGMSRMDNTKCCTSVNQYTKDYVLINTFRSIKEAKAKTHVNNISRCCSGGRPTAGGYIWRYSDEIFTN